MDFVGRLTKTPRPLTSIFCAKRVAEVAGILESTEAAINSALQRARAAIAGRHAESSTPSALAPGQAEVVERFVHAWDGEPRPGRYRIVPAPMNGEPGALAYVRAPDGRYHAVCLTVLSLDAGGRVVELTTFVLPELFAAWGFPPVLDA